jgi:hypothetical protein
MAAVHTGMAKTIEMQSIVANLKRIKIRTPCSSSRKRLGSHSFPANKKRFDRLLHLYFSVS